MASLMRRKPAPRKGKASPRKTKGQVRRTSPLKPGLRGIRNWTAGQVRGAKYSTKGAVRMALLGTVLLGGIIFSGLALGGFLPDIQYEASKFTENRLRSAGFEVEHVHVVGEGRMHENEVRAALGIRSGDYLFDADLREAQIRVQSLPWVKDAMVRRLWPDQYVVHIIERQPMALWQKDGQLSVIDDEGLVIETANAREFTTLPVYIGEGAAKSAGDFQVLIQDYPSIGSRVDAAIRVGERRWDVTLAGGQLRILLPEHNPEQALSQLTRMQVSHQLLDQNIAIIDMRIPGRMIVRPTEDTSRPLYVKMKRQAA